MVRRRKITIGEKKTEKDKGTKKTTEEKKDYTI
jgi:hypothetical protein